MADVIMTVVFLLIPLFGVRALVQLAQSWLLNRTIRLAIDNRSADLPMLLEKLEQASVGWRQDAVGWSLSGLGLAMAAGGLLDEGSVRTTAIQFALLPMFVGAALIAHHRFVRSRS